MNIKFRLAALSMVSALLVSSCSQSIPDRAGRKLYAAAQYGTGCQSGDQAILSWYKHTGPESATIDTANNLADASGEYAECAKKTGLSPTSGRLLMFAAISDYEAALRYAESKATLKSADLFITSSLDMITLAKQVHYSKEIDIDDLLPTIDPDATALFYDIKKQIRSQAAE